MKTGRTSIAVITVIAGLALGVQAQDFLTNGLIASYPFAGNANNVAGGLATNGVTNGVSIVPTNSRFGYSGGALHFGGGSYISVTPTPFAVNSNWTISFWVKLDGTSSVENFLSTGWDNQGGMNMRYVPATWQFGGQPSIANGLAVSSTNNPAKWNMMTGVRSSNTAQLYLDGVLLGTATWQSATLNSGSFWFGRHQSGATYDLIGSMSDIRIYNRGLSSAEIQQLYQYEVVPSCTPYRATATARVTGGLVVGATVTDSGCGYTNKPLVWIEGGGGSGATATAVVNNGEVTGINITDTGNGYTSAPTIYIFSPTGLQLGLVKAVVPTFTDLVPGTPYQLQVSLDMTNWIDEGVPFTASNPVEAYSQYFDVANANQLYFRLLVAP